MANENVFKISGVIYEKPLRTVTSKKDGKDYEFKSIILEVNRQYKDTIYTELPEFQLARNVDDSNFAVGDTVEVSFSLSGKKFKTFHKTEVKALYLRHPDRQYNDTKAVGFDPKIAVKKEDVFVAPNPYEEEESEDSNLPFWSWQ